MLNIQHQQAQIRTPQHAHKQQRRIHGRERRLPFQPRCYTQAGGQILEDADGAVDAGAAGVAAEGDGREGHGFVGEDGEDVGAEDARAGEEVEGAEVGEGGVGEGVPRGWDDGAVGEGDGGVEVVEGGVKGGGDGALGCGGEGGLVGDFVGEARE